MPDYHTDYGDAFVCESRFRPVLQKRKRRPRLSADPSSHHRSSRLGPVLLSPQLRLGLSRPPSHPRWAGTCVAPISPWATTVARSRPTTPPHSTTPRLPSWTRRPSAPAQRWSERVRGHRRPPPVQARRCLQRAPFGHGPAKRRAKPRGRAGNASLAHSANAGPPAPLRGKALAQISLPPRRLSLAPRPFLLLPGAATLPPPPLFVNAELRRTHFSLGEAAADWSTTVSDAQTTGCVVDPEERARKKAGERCFGAGSARRPVLLRPLCTLASQASAPPSAGRCGARPGNQRRSPSRRCDLPQTWTSFAASSGASTSPWEAKPSRTTPQPLLCPPLTPWQRACPESAKTCTAPTLCWATSPRTTAARRCPCLARSP